MNTKSAIDTFMAALKSNRFDVKFLGVTVGKADSWGIPRMTGLCTYCTMASRAMVRH